MANINTECIIKDYDRIYLTSGLRANSAYYRWMIGLLQPKPYTKLLDVSCGEGILLREVAKLKAGIGIFGLDISNVAVDIAKKNTPESKVVLADGQKIPFLDKSFDYITCLGSLEHYRDPELGIRELSRIAKKNALLCIVLPNSFDINSILEVLMTGKKSPENFQILERAATKNEWVDLLKKNGIQVKSTYASNLWPELFQEGTCKIKSLPKYFKRLAIKLFCPLHFAREFVFICSKNS